MAATIEFSATVRARRAGPGAPRDNKRQPSMVPDGKTVGQPLNRLRTLSQAIDLARTLAPAHRVAPLQSPAHPSSGFQCTVAQPADRDAGTSRRRLGGEHH